MPPPVPFGLGRRDLFRGARRLQPEILAGKVEQLLLREGGSALTRFAIGQRLILIERSDQHRQGALVAQAGQRRSSEEPLVCNG